MFTQRQGTLNIPVEDTALMFRVPEIQYKSVCPVTVYPKICEVIAQSLQTNAGVTFQWGHHHLHPLYFLLTSHPSFEAIDLKKKKFPELKCANEGNFSLVANVWNVHLHKTAALPCDIRNFLSGTRRIMEYCNN